MTDHKLFNSSGLDTTTQTAKLREYQPPRVVPVGNVRDLVAGSFNSNQDGDGTGTIQ